jgi:hypothetical protein
MTLRDRLLADAAKAGQLLIGLQDAVAASIAGRGSTILITVLGSDGKPVSRPLAQYEIDALAAAVAPVTP